MAITTKITFRFDGVKLDAMGPQIQVTSARPGGVAQGSDGPIDQYAGQGETHSIEQLTFRIRPSGLAFRPWSHTLPGQEFDVTWNEGDPNFGGTQQTLQSCLCEGQTTTVNNENGDITVTIPRVRGTRRVPGS